MTTSEMLLDSAERYAMLTAMSVNVSEDQSGAKATRQSRMNISKHACNGSSTVDQGQSLHLFPVVVGEQYSESPIVDLQFPLPADLVNYTNSRNISSITIPSSLVRERLEELEGGGKQKMHTLSSYFQSE